MFGENIGILIFGQTVIKLNIYLSLDKHEPDMFSLPGKKLLE